jgi:hypothetical protein
MGRHANSTGDALHAVLHQEADRHEPDRVAILARFEAGRETTRRPGLVHPRFLVTAAAAAAGVAVIAGGIWAATSRHPTADQVGQVGPVKTTARQGGATSTAAVPQSPHSTALGGSQAPRHQTSPTPGKSSGGSPSTKAAAQQGFLWSDGSIDPHSSTNWAQSNIMLKNRETMTALDVKVRIAITAGVTSAGQWSTVGADILTMTVTKQKDALVYEFTLKPGATLAAGTYTFAAQYAHASGGRDAGQDTYAATATAHGSDVQVSGNFY